MQHNIMTFEGGKGRRGACLLRSHIRRTPCDKWRKVLELQREMLRLTVRDCPACELARRLIQWVELKGWWQPSCKVSNKLHFFASCCRVCFPTRCVSACGSPSSLFLSAFPLLDHPVTRCWLLDLLSFMPPHHVSFFATVCFSRLAFCLLSCFGRLDAWQAYIAATWPHAARHLLGSRGRRTDRRLGQLESWKNDQRMNKFIFKKKELYRSILLFMFVVVGFMCGFNNLGGWNLAFWREYSHV